MFKKLLGKREEGFTLIEIVIVLAIAAGIMVIVFVAVSGAQAARRDTARKADVSRIRAAMEQYAGNNAGAYPTGAVACATADSFCDKYLGGTAFKDPSGTTYVVAVGATFTATAITAPSGTINIGAGAVNGAKCSGGAIVADTGKPRSYAIQYYLEQGSVTCVDNQ